MKLTDMAHQFAGLHLHAGSIAIDATIGNGHDTLFLAKHVGESGHVHGFDIQPDALSATTQRLSEANLAERVTLHQTGHENLSRTLPQANKGQIDVALFNLGYLPGSDRSTITTSETTLPALAQALEELTPSGLLLVTLYPGHPGGDQEAADVAEWAKSLAPSLATASEYRLLNRSPHAPRLLLIQRVSHCAS